MKSYFSCLLFLILLMTSCKDEATNRQAENAKDVKKKEIIFDHINKSWNFNAKPTNAVSRSLLNTWTEWRDFINELSQKPKMTIGAFQKKAKSLSKKIVSSMMPDATVNRTSLHEGAYILIPLFRCI